MKEQVVPSGNILYLVVFLMITITRIKLLKVNVSFEVVFTDCILVHVNGLSKQCQEYIQESFQFM